MLTKHYNTTSYSSSISSGNSTEPLDESIANGGAALATYTKLQFSAAVCTEALAKALLRYCELDTLAMVKVWEKLKETL